MRANDREDRDQTKRSRLQPHVKWASKLIALHQCKLSDAEREQVEAHLRDCKACSDAYLVYRGVAGLFHDLPPLKAPSELPPALQARKEELLAEDAQAARKRERPATLKETLEEVTGNQPQQQPARRKKSAAPNPADPAPEEEAAHPAVAEAKRILRAAKRTSHTK